MALAKDETPLNLGRALKVLRKEKGLSQEALAQAAQLSSQTLISRWELGKATPRAALLERVMNALEATWADIRRAAYRADQTPETQDSTTEKFCRLLARWRLQAGIPQGRLAVLADVDSSHLSHIESEGGVSLPVLDRVLGALGVDLLSLLETAMEASPEAQHTAEGYTQRDAKFIIPALTKELEASQADSLTAKRLLEEARHEIERLRKQGPGQEEEEPDA